MLKYVEEKLEDVNKMDNGLVMQNKTTEILKGILLITGTSIGGGMLALPVLTSLAGFLPSLVVYLLCWLFMAGSGLLLLEVCCWMDSESNIVSMARRTLGKPGKWAAWMLYLFLFYCLTIAYIVGCGQLVSDLFQSSVSVCQGCIIFVLLFAPWVYAGARMVGRINGPLMLGLGVSYLAFVFIGYEHIKPELLAYRDWSFIPLALPIAFTAFAYQGIIPTLVTYMHRDVKAIRTAIIVGSFIPFIIYGIWQGLILGIVPTFGPDSLQVALQNGHNAVEPLKYSIDSPHVYIIGRFFAFFALVTSFLGVTLALTDFLSDGLGIKKTRWGMLFLCLITFIPPSIVAFINPGIFLVALDYAGGFGCALLLGLLPILMVWSGRYRLGLKSEYSLPGGRIILILMILFVVFELVSQFSVIFKHEV